MSRPLGAVLAAAMACAGVVAGGAQGQAQQTSGAVVAELAPAETLALGNPLAVFAFVLNSLPERVQVLPTENYFYFRFAGSGVSYTGNIRLAAADRDQGKLHFAATEPRRDLPVTHRVLDRSQGVTVEKLAPLAYRVGFKDKSVIFGLNELSQVTPPGALRSEERFIGPVFDESGLRFFLVFNSRLKVFHYVLDDSHVPDELFTSRVNKLIQIGKRTGFAFVEDGARRILVGVQRQSSELNTPSDGPFDQLPENFIQGETLREAIVAADPSAKGKVDRLGHFADGSGRYLIHPYMLYKRERDLAVFARCLSDRRVPEAERPRCLVIDDDEAQKRNPQPMALKRR
jgi:hypothetical protein